MYVLLYTYQQHKNTTRIFYVLLEDKVEIKLFNISDFTDTEIIVVLILHNTWLF